MGQIDPKKDFLEWLASADRSRLHDSCHLRGHQLLRLPGKQLLDEKRHFKLGAKFRNASNPDLAAILRRLGTVDQSPPNPSVRLFSLKVQIDLFRFENQDSNQ